MKGKYLVFFTLFLNGISLSEVISEIRLPLNFNESNLFVREINNNSPVPYNTVESGGCGNIKFKEYMFPSKNKVNTEDNNPADTFPVNTWVCLLSDTVYGNGYDRSMNERIVYSRSKSLWVKANNKNSDIIPTD